MQLYNLIMLFQNVFTKSFVFRFYPGEWEVVFVCEDIWQGGAREKGRGDSEGV